MIVTCYSLDHCRYDHKLHSQQVYSTSHSINFFNAIFTKCQFIEYFTRVTYEGSKLS
jgi:hypothetical protein